MMNNSGLRAKYLTGPALEFYPDVNNRLHIKILKPFLKKHRAVWTKMAALDKLAVFNSLTISIIKSIYQY